MSELDRLALGVLLPAFAGLEPEPDLLRLLDRGLGGVCLFGSNTAGGAAGVTAYTAAVHTVRPDAVIATDEEGGDVTRLHAAEGSPALAPLALGVTGDLDLTRRTGRAVGLELARLGIDLDLAPVADVNADPRNPVIGTRSFGADPALVASHTVAWVDGLQSAGVAACVKHFPGHGAVTVDSHLGRPVLDANAQLLRSRELVPFAAAVDAGVAAVMTAHLVVSALDPTAPATTSARVLSVLRGALGFRGAIVSDALDMAGVAYRGGIPETAVRALAAGVDLLCLGPGGGTDLVDSVRAAVVRAVRHGTLDEERLAGAVAAVRRLRRTEERTAVRIAESEMTGPADVRRSVTVAGTLPALAGAIVVRIDREPDYGWEPTPWGLPADAVLAPGSAVEAPGPVLIQVRDAHRDEEVLRTLASAPPGAVVLEWGWPGLRGDALPTIHAHGWSRPSAGVVVEILRQAGWDR